MKQNGVMPKVAHFNHLISNLLHDGDIVAAQRLEHRYWSRSKRWLSWLGTFQRLLSAGKATTAHCNWVLEHVSTGVEFDNGLVRAMQYENIPIDEDAWAMAHKRREVRMVKMKAMEEKNILTDEEAWAMVKANRRGEKLKLVLKEFSFFHGENGRERRKKRRERRLNQESLRRILAEEGKDSARKYFKTLQQNKHADAAYFGWAMRKLCETSDESRSLMESMKQNGVLPEVSNYTQLINNLLYDGNLDAAQHVYDVDMLVSLNLKVETRALRTIEQMRMVMIMD
jgi:hypothetical protein